MKIALKTLPLCAVALLAECASAPLNISRSSDEPKNLPAITTQTWKVGRYQIRFAAGPVRLLPEGGQRGFSTYSVFYQEQDEAPMSEVAGSAIDIELLLEPPSLDLGNSIETWVSPSERWLMIKENVPNDCAPCANFLLFERQEAKLVFTYLEMPSWQPPPKVLKGGIMPPLFAEKPVILKLTEDEVEFCFSDKKVQRLKLQEVPLLPGPVFPG